MYLKKIKIKKILSAFYKNLKRKNSKKNFILKLKIFRESLKMPKQLN